jgi:uncharacterized secreted protein with C-terminal beta-propeller domain
MIQSCCSRYRTALLAGAVLLLSACNNGGGGAPQTSPRLFKAASSVELETRLKAELINRYQRQETRYLYVGMGGGGPGATGGMGEVMTPQDATNTSMPHSETNVQEAGVDEGDLVKTDGSFIFLARGSHFLVLQAQPPAGTVIVSDIDLQEPISELHLATNRLTVISAPFTVTGSPVTRLSFYDVTTPVTPVLTLRVDFPGTLQGSRRINDTIYVVTNHRIDLSAPVSLWDYLPAGTFDQNAFNAASARATAENVRQIDALTLVDLIPTYSRIVYNGGVGGSPSVSPAVGFGDLYIPETGNGTDLSLVFAIDTLPAEPVVTSSGVLSAWCRLYMSQENLYLASGNNWNWIEPLAGASRPDANPEPWTALHKFAVANGVGQPLYRGSGVVNGWLNDQFSMGEYNGNLRIGTTRGGWWGEGISNQLAIFAEQDNKLIETGKIEGLAPGERIYAMRFDRDRGYMVTFRQTDPLFTFDLSDPAAPRTVGELKVDGFATYMQLIGPANNRLLTIGRSADASGRVIGNKLQLFDVTSLAAPLLLGSFELGQGWSSALYDHHAFLYYEPLGLLTIPYYSFDFTPAGYSAGLRVFSVNAGGIVSRGTIPAQAVSTGYGTYADTVDRAVIIGTNIYSLAHRSVTVAGADLLDIKKVVGLPEGYGYYNIGGPGVLLPAALRR